MGIMEEDQGFEVCEESHVAEQEMFYCPACEVGFCSTCWDQQIAHRPNRRGQALHVRANYHVARKIRRVLSPSADESVQESLYGADASTSWFGIDRNNDGPLLFRDYGRYAELLDMTDNDRSSDSDRQSFDSGLGVARDRRTPSLVSFVGQTGAGKSTLIRLLIEFHCRADWKYGAPVVGRANADTPSSEDVHLYLDPRTALTDAPFLWADCEGLEGGEREPLGAKFKKNRLANAETIPYPDLGSARYSSERELIWANSSETKSREFAVAQLYPRILYTFSDVIVFVLRNPRSVSLACGLIS